MKPLAMLRQFLVFAGSSLLAMGYGHAQTTYTWTQTASGNQSWTTAGNWSSSAPFVSGSGNNHLRFFADNTTTIATTSLQTITNVPATLSMNTLTLNGKGPNNPVGFPVTIGTNASAWTLGDGTTSTVNLSSTLGGGSADRDIRYTIAANLALRGGTGGITTFTGDSGSITGAVFSGNITETSAGKGITKSGSSLLVFSGNNSYTGTTSVNGGTLRIASANALSGGIGSTGGLSALTLNGGVIELAAGDFSRGLGTASSQFRITGGTSGFSARDDHRVVTAGGDPSQELQWNSTHFAPGALVLNSASANNSIELTNNMDFNGTNRTVQVNAGTALLSGDIRNTVDFAGLIKTGSGTLVLTGNNSYNGSTILSGGTLSVGAANQFGTSGGLFINAGSTLQITGTELTSLHGTWDFVSFNNGSIGFDIQDAANVFTMDEVLIQDVWWLTKSGAGTLVLNQDCYHYGNTVVTGGGTLVLDYTTNYGSKLSDGSGLNLNGSALVLKGGEDEYSNHNEEVGSTGLGTYTSNSISRDGGFSTISFGTISTNLNSTLSIAEPGLATTTSGNTNGILNAGRVTVGSHFGSNDGSNNIVAYGSYATATTAGGGSSTAVHQLNGGGTMTANLATYSLRIANGGNSDVLNLGANSINLTNNTTLLYAGGFDNQYTINGTGALTSASGNQPFVINTYAGTTLTVNARTSAGSANVSKAGKGTLVLGGNNTNVAGVFVQEGVLRVTHNDGLGTTTAGTHVHGGAALELANNIAIGTEALSLDGAGFFDGTSHRGALRNRSGTNSWAGAITTGASGARIDSDAGSALTLTGGIATTLTKDVTFGGAGNTTVSTTAISGTGSVIKDGNGTLTLSTSNTYTGPTIISGGTLVLTGATHATRAIRFTGGTLQLQNGSPVTAANAAVDLTNGSITVNGATGDASYTLLTAASITGTPSLSAPVPGYQLQVVGNQLCLVAVEGPGPVASFAISSIASPQTVGTPITGITITAMDATTQTATSFTGTVTFGGTAGITGTSASFINGVLSGVSVTPTVAGSNLSFTVDNGAGQTGSVTFNVQSLFQDWASDNGLSGDDAAYGADPDGDGLTNLQEFAFGTLPNAGLLNPLQFVSGGEVTLPGPPVLRAYTPPQGKPPFQAVFGRRKNHAVAGITYTAEFSANLSYWTASNSGSTVLTGEGSHEIEVVAVPFPETVPLSLGGTTATPKFFRINVTTTP